jgi:hypothetical protein
MSFMIDRYIGVMGSGKQWVLITASQEQLVARDAS